MNRAGTYVSWLTFAGGGILIGLLVAPVGRAAGHEAAAQQAACATDAHSAFGFWVGEWDVRSAAGQAGRNRITSILGGCVLLEEYETPSGYAGKSLNIYDQTTGRWHQTWVDNGGLLLQLDGGMEAGRMVLEGERLTRAGARVSDRIAWTPNDDGTVRQHWQVSSDGGETWSTVFDGTYHPAD